MRNYAAALVAMSLIAGPVLADEMKSGDMNMTRDAGTMTKKHKSKDCVMMKDGKMMVMKGGQTMPMDVDMTMTDGSMVMRDGTMMMKDGSKMMLKDGDRVDMNGKMMKPMKMKQK